MPHDAIHPRRNPVATGHQKTTSDRGFPQISVGLAGVLVASPDSALTRGPSRPDQQTGRRSCQEMPRPSTDPSRLPPAARRMPSVTSSCQNPLTSPIVYSGQQRPIHLGVVDERRRANGRQPADRPIRQSYDRPPPLLHSTEVAASAPIAGGRFRTAWLVRVCMDFTDKTVWHLAGPGPPRVVPPD